MSSAASKRKSDMKWFVKKIKADSTLFYGLRYKYKGNWYHKNGTLRKADAHNFDKMLFDVIFESLGIDDSRLVEWYGEKVQSNESCVEVELWLSELRAEKEKTK